MSYGTTGLPSPIIMGWRLRSLVQETLGFGCVHNLLLLKKKKNTGFSIISLAFPLVNSFHSVNSSCTCISACLLLVC